MLPKDWQANREDEGYSKWHTPCGKDAAAADEVRVEGDSTSEVRVEGDSTGEVRVPAAFECQKRESVWMEGAQVRVHASFLC